MQDLLRGAVFVTLGMPVEKFWRPIVAVLPSAVAPSGNSSPLDFLNELAHGPEYDGVRYLLSFLVAIIGLVRVGLPILVTILYARRDRATVKTGGAQITYEALWKMSTNENLQQRVVNENLFRDVSYLADREKQLTSLLHANGIPVPHGSAPRKIGPREVFGAQRKAAKEEREQ
jgi:hypothetical protein